MQLSRPCVKESLFTVQKRLLFPIVPRRAFGPYQSTSAMNNDISDDVLNAKFARLLLDDSSSSVISSHSHTISAVSTEPAHNKGYYSWKTYPSNHDVQLHYIRNELQANVQISKLQGTALGFDMEWPFVPGRYQGKTAVVQLCDEERILIIQLSAMKGQFPENLKKVIESPTILKLGANILGDGRKLERDFKEKFGIEPRGLLELSHLAHAVDPDVVKTKKVMALKRIVELYTGFTLRKEENGPRNSSWDTELNIEQLTYAANDVHCALSVYKILIGMANERKITLLPHEDGLRITYDSPTRPRTRVVTQVAPVAVVSRITTLAPQDVQKDMPPPSTQHATSPISTNCYASSAASSISEKPISPQFRKAYELWHNHDLSMDDLRVALRSAENPLAESTVISYVVSALTADRTLTCSKRRLIELVKHDSWLWKKHKWWIYRLP